MWCFRFGFLLPGIFVKANSSTVSGLNKYQTHQTYGRIFLTYPQYHTPPNILQRDGGNALGPYSMHVCVYTLASGGVLCLALWSLHVPTYLMSMARRGFPPFSGGEEAGQAREAGQETQERKEGEEAPQDGWQRSSASTPWVLSERSPVRNQPISDYITVGH